MNEIESNIKTIQLWRQSRPKSNSMNNYEWCVYVGFWETSNYIADRLRIIK